MLLKKVFCVSAVTLAAVAAVALTVWLLIQPEKSPWESEDEIEEGTVVNTKLGTVNGSVFYTRLGKKFLGFRGVRYAEPPIGDLRFKPPVPVKRWDGIFDATEEGPSCPQPADFEISEDCLRLNVYTSGIPRGKNPKLKPVFAWLHGGGFVVGSSISSNAGGEYLLDREVVMVTINYRLASLGFMSTGTKEAPGNNGFKDQSIALRWIRDNIRNFGGDPNSVTLMGQSAGSRSAMLHLVSPMSQGLFHRAILMSGGVTALWEVPTHQLHLARKQAAIFQCPEDDVEQMIDCLRKVDADMMGKTLEEFQEFNELPFVVWYPVIEPDFGQERFLVEDPKLSIARGNFSLVPIIIGITNDELDGTAISIIDNPANLKLMNKAFETFAPICFMYERDTSRSKEISKALWENFIHAPQIDRSSIKSLSKLMSDAVVGFTVHRFVQLAHKFTKVYYYKNTFVGRDSNFFYPPGAVKPYGVAHSDDLIYILKQSFPMITRENPEAAHLEKVLDLWVSFAYSGNPNSKSDNSHYVDDDWVPYDEVKENFLEIGDEFVLRSQMLKERYRIWNSIFPLK